MALPSEMTFALGGKEKYFAFENSKMDQSINGARNTFQTHFFATDKKIGLPFHRVFGRYLTNK